MFSWLILIFNTLFYQLLHFNNIYICLTEETHKKYDQIIVTLMQIYFYIWNFIYFFIELNKNIFSYMLCKHFLYYLRKITSKQIQQLLKPTAMYNDPFKFIHDNISLWLHAFFDKVFKITFIFLMIFSRVV